MMNRTRKLAWVDGEVLPGWLAWLSGCHHLLPFLTQWVCSPAKTMQFFLSSSSGREKYMLNHFGLIPSSTPQPSCSGLEKWKHEIVNFLAK
jgi:hypothetical protein